MNVPFVDGSIVSFESVGVWVFKDSSLMGIFLLLVRAYYEALMLVYAIWSMTNEVLVLQTLYFEKTLVPLQYIVF